MITTRFYLDDRRNNDPNVPAPLKIYIRWKGQTAYLFSGVKIPPIQWDSRSLTTKDKTTQLTLNRIKYKVDSKLAELQEDHYLDGLTALGIKNLLERNLSPESEKPQRFMDVFKECASDPKKKVRTREIYEATIAKIEKFDPKSQRLEFADITVAWLDQFDSFLALTSPKKNARSIHFRNIRAVFNYAIKRDITMYYPFRHKYSIKSEPTAKRALSVGNLRKLIAADLPKWQSRYRDYFVLTFMLIGINTEDLIHATEINGGRLEYLRAKTGKPYSIKIEPEAEELIAKYRGKGQLLDIMDTYSATKNWTSHVNTELKAIANKLGLPKISVYWARHTWNTLAISDLGIPQKTAEAAMGQSSKSVNDIYLDFDRSNIDKANRQVMDYVLYDKKPEDVHKLIKQMSEDLARLRKESTK